MSQLSVLVTGASGFVGRAVTAEFKAAGHRVTGTSTDGDAGLVALDMDDRDRIEEVLAEAGPDTIVHLAGIQSVSDCWQDPVRAFRVNTGGTAALLLALERSASQAHVILASTAAVYGRPRDDTPGGRGGGAALPFGEEDPVHPQSPYAASKAAAEILAGETATRTGLPVTIARLFNQFGPGQPGSQVPAGFAASIVQAETEGAASVKLEIGNPDARRDYTDNRDTARALRLVGERRVTGRLNFCSGRTHSLARLIDGLSAASEIAVEVAPRPELANRNDVPVIAGSPARLEGATGWQPEVPLERTLSEMLESRRTALNGG